MADIAVVDYGMGNLRSVAQALRAVAPDAAIVVSDDPRVIAQASRVVFPGQGAMPDCMRELDGRGLRDVVLQAARNKPFLGICRGCQVMNVALGGTLYTHLPDQLPNALDHSYPGNLRTVLVHEVKIEEGTRIFTLGADVIELGNAFHKLVGDFGGGATATSSDSVYKSK